MIELAGGWLFFALAAVAVLVLGVSKSGFGTGFGALSVPLISIAVPVPTAAAVLLPVLLAMDLLSVFAYRKDFDRALIAFLLPAALVGVIAGTLVFAFVDPMMIGVIVGVITIVFVLYRAVIAPRLPQRQFSRPVGAILSATSGFTTFVAHAGGPPINAYLMPMRLAPTTYAATIAVLFLFVNLAKWVPYGIVGLLTPTNLITALILMPFAPIGVLLGIKIARRINERVFYILVTAGMLATGLVLLVRPFLPWGQG